MENPTSTKHKYDPIYHLHDAGTEAKLGQYMRKHIFFYAYSESEVISAYSRKRLDDIEKAVKHTLKERLPKRTDISKNGIHSEVLLDLLLALYYPQNCKLATRAIYRQQSDNQEIKGFDGLHFVIENGKKYIWLGQAKMGGRDYCINSIIDDLNDKMNMIYTAEQLFFIADKENKVTDEALQFLNDINDTSWVAGEIDSTKRAEVLTEFLKKENVELILPCLLAYEEPMIYSDENLISTNMTKEIEKIIKKFDSKFKSLVDIPYSVLILMIPIRKLKPLRESVLS